MQTVNSPTRNWTISPQSMGLTQKQVEIAEAAFDRDFYLAANPELDDRGVDPFVHYMTQGWREGRDPSAHFETLAYLMAHRDVLRAGTNPFVHWLEAETNVGSGSTWAGLDSAATVAPVPVSAAAVPVAYAAQAAAPVVYAAQPAESLAPLFSGETEPEGGYNPTGLEGLTAREVATLREAFDIDYYLAQDTALATLADPFLHYMAVGWRRKLDPSPDFSTEYYLKSHADIAAAGINPFRHWVLFGRDERRGALSFRQGLAKVTARPSVSAIVPNYNHGRFLAQRIDSILCQTYDNISITVLDDCSSDDSRDVIDEYVARYPGRIRAIYNETNSGGVFRQWRKAIAETEGDLVWICESDDFCEPDFVERLVPHFRDRSVHVAFGRILETDIDGVPNDSLDTYRENAEPGIWDVSLVRPAAEWFANGFGVSNVIANVGGCLWRRAPISDDVWQEAQTYRVVGDWYLYIQVAGGGQIAWEPSAVSYFRRHGSNTSSKSFQGPNFYNELERLMVTLRSAWTVPEATVRHFYSHIVRQYEWFELEPKFGPLERHCSLTKMLQTQRTRPHLLMAMYGFIPGGGENFPIHLANHLVAAGWLVSFIIFETSTTNEFMRRSLNPAVAIYEAAWAVEYGAQRFLDEAGITIIHSHTVGAEMRFFHIWKVDDSVAYVVTLHGSYEASELGPEMVRQLAAPVDHFVYTADKNLKPLEPLRLPAERFTKLPNAMPIDPAPFPRTRAEMGIADDAIVFTLVARGIIRKGWRAAVGAFVELRKRHPGRSMHLCLVGEGDTPDALAKLHGRDPDISFLGYQSHINGLYRMTDVAIVPTRFSGESFPLCIIQALQVGTPVVASDVGEIRSMLIEDGRKGGIVIDPVRDTKKFTHNLLLGMEQMLDAPTRARYAAGAALLGEHYDMDRLVKVYADLYRRVLAAPRDHGESQIM
ncbi:glycosyltransferase [Sphingomonas qilianensis]|uniref:Glycosyltransferase n=1 Tax=Sphingomonas qilianensis TaxID=1736690 RepID=A0ABU9XRD4_9SPHN